MKQLREPIWHQKALPTVEGAGVHLKRAMGYHEVPRFDPFLLFDDFSGDDPRHFEAGFPWHPHRGIETITYVLEGEVAHGDSLGNSGVIGPGDVQWMTAGSGIVHQEMPQGQTLRGYQLWANLPRASKMIQPSYRDIQAAQIPSAELDDGVTARIICGELGGVRGPVDGIAIEAVYADILMSPSSSLSQPLHSDLNAFVYMTEGSCRIGSVEKGLDFDAGTIVDLGKGDMLSVQAASHGARFLLVAGKPLDEPVAWGGPIVMNTDEEVAIAFSEYRNGTFLKHD